MTRAALTYALKKRDYPKNVVFHTDRGVEYRGAEFQSLLSSHQFKHSMNRPGQCTDNAFMESFFHSLKTELIRGTSYNSPKELRRELARYINKFYNTRRLHSGLEYMSPCKYEQQAV